MARKVIDQAMEAEGKLPIPDQQVIYRRSRAQFRVFTGAAALVAGAVLIGLEAQPPWLGWTVCITGLVAIYLGRPKPPTA